MRYQIIIQGFDIQNWIVDTFYLGGQSHILWFPTDNLNHIRFSLVISKCYNILIHCGTQNRKPKSYGKVYNAVDKSI